jgi:di/tricarboxylate transporter
MEGDLLLVEGLRDDILKIKDTAGIDLKADYKMADPEIEGEELQLAEIIILQGSPFVQRTLKTLRFRERYNLQVLAVNRNNETIRRKLSSISLRVGDTILVQGTTQNLSTLASDDTLRIVGSLPGNRHNTRRAPIAIAIFVGVLLAASLNILSIPVAVLLGAALTFVTKCITPQEAYRQIEWTIIILVGSMLALGVAMETTGTADYLAGLVVGLAGDIGGIGLLTLFFVLAVLLTQPMSNQAAAIVLIPVAIQTANQLGLNPRTFAMMIAVAASCSYLTPLEPACLMVYGPGRYKFMDFVKVGALLTGIVYLIAIFLVPMVWPLTV